MLYWIWSMIWSKLTFIYQNSFLFDFVKSFHWISFYHSKKRKRYLPELSNQRLSLHWGASQLALSPVFPEPHHYSQFHGCSPHLYTPEPHHYSLFHGCSPHFDVLESNHYYFATHLITFYFDVDCIMVREGRGTNLSWANLITFTCFAIDLIYAATLNMWGNRWAEERCKVFTQKHLSQRVATLLSFTKVEISQKQNCFVSINVCQKI